MHSSAPLPIERHRFGQVVVDYRSAQGPTVQAVRGATLLPQLERLKLGEHYDRYLASLPTAQREQLLYLTALSWLPVSVACAHFDACDGLAFGDAEAVEHGWDGGRSIAPAIMGTLLRAAGMSPLSALAAIDRVWPRMHEGGAVLAIQTGPKDVFIEQRGNPMSRSRYYRTSALGFYRALAEVFSKRAFVRAATPTQPDAQSFAVAISWV